MGFAETMAEEEKLLSEEDINLAFADDEELHQQAEMISLQNQEQKNIPAFEQHVMGKLNK